MELRNKIEDSLYYSRVFLDKSCINNQWNDFHTRSSGESNEWITAFVLSHSATDFPDATAKFAEHFVASRGIIGYNSAVPPDSDSSCWGILALVFNDIPISESLFSLWHAFIKSHWTDNLRIGFSTYLVNSPIIAYKSKNGGWNQFDGWTKTGCNEITALVFYALCKIHKFRHWEQHAEQWIDFLLEDHAIRSYWWVSPMYAYRTIVEAMYAITSETPRLAIKCHHLLKRIGDEVLSDYSLGYDLSAFDCANQLIVCNMLSSMTEIDNDAPFVDVIGKSLVRLLGMQLEDGSWCSDAIMRIPYPNDTEPWNSSYFSTDVHGTGGILGDSGIISTAIARQAIRTILRRKTIK